MQSISDTRACAGSHRKEEATGKKKPPAGGSGDLVPPEYATHLLERQDLQRERPSIATGIDREKKHASHVRKAKNAFPWPYVKEATI